LVYRELKPEQFGLSPEGPKEYCQKSWLFHPPPKGVNFQQVVREEKEEEARITKRERGGGGRKGKFGKGQVMFSNSLKTNFQ